MHSNDDVAVAIVELQQRILMRMQELGYANQDLALRISRHLAEISVLGEVFAKTTLPLFLSMNSEHSDSLAALSLSVKCDLEEIGDAISDVDGPLRDLTEFLGRGSTTEPIS
jgi:hypothetical protein